MISIYTDGSCYWKDKKGGLGIVIFQGKNKIKSSFTVINTTVGRVEILAAIKGLELLLSLGKIEKKIVVYCDSEYVVYSINSFIPSHLENKTTPEKNWDILKKLWNLYLRFKDIEFKWVKGHSGVEGNEIADSLASKARKGEINIFTDIKI